jgi:DNA modification methylase
MPAGCDFVCKNEDCDCFDTGFTITGPWPMGSIDDIINCSAIKELPQLQEQIKNLKDTGRDYACIKFPNTDKVETKCYRVNLWSIKGKCLWQYDVMVKEGDDLQTAIKNANLPEKCPSTGSKMLNFRDVTKEGINCPHCDKKLDQKRWFTNED